MKKVTDQILGKITGMVLDLLRRVREGSLDPYRVIKGLQEIVEGKQDISEFLSGWQSFYYKHFNLRCDFANLAIPERPAQGKWFLIVVVGGITLQRFFDKCSELFKACKWTEDSLNDVVTSDRTAKDGAYAVWIRDTREADEDLKGLSANDLKEKGIVVITLEERLLFELKYFDETGVHLDVENVTLCSGSHCSNGNILYVDQINHCMSIDSHSSDNQASNLCAREVVALVA